jgi:HlyD family secretion protein
LDSIAGNSPQAVLDQALSNASLHLGIVRKLLDKTALALNIALNINTSTISAFKSSVNTGRTNVNTAATSVNSQQQTILSQKITVKKIDSELKLKLAGSTAEQISAQEAAVKQAAAKAQGIRAQISKTVLRSPITGVVTKQDAKIGEIAAAGAVLVSVISQNKLEVEAKIPEVDIAKVKIGDLSTLTLDAYRNDVVFEAKVSFIDPAETITEGVPTYKTKFNFLKEDERIKPGMTANIDIVTNKHEGVISIPQRAVIKENKSEYVLVYNNEGKSERRQVKTGLRDSEGYIEITEGLSVGEKIAASPEKK